MPRTILLVDDDPNYARTVQTCLTESGHHVIVVFNGDSAWEQILLNRPDLLVVRLPLPEVFTLLTRLRDEPVVPALPTITILRSWADEEAIRTGWALGVDAFLPVQFNCLELRVYIERIFQSVDEG